MSEKEVQEAAIAFAKRSKERLAKQLTDPKKYIPDATPVSVFMAGSPGAGKTEFSKGLVGVFESGKECRVVRIDPDDVRSLMPGYTGDNSFLFQGAVSLIVEKMHDLVLHNNQTFIMDGTFSKYEKAIVNIKRSLEKKRQVSIFYVYQEPKVAWGFTVAREKAEGRNIPKAAFIEQFFGARETVQRVRNEFGSEVVVYLVQKDFEKGTSNTIAIPPGASVDEHFEKRYTKEALEKEL